MANTILNVKEFTWQVILNPNACDKKCFEHWSEISAKLSAVGIQHVLHLSDACGKGIQLAKSLCEQGFRHIIVIGGDGTINEVVNGIFLSGVDTHEVYLSVLPLGRGNDWARAHDFPQGFMQSIEVLLQGKFLSHDIGTVRSIQTSGKSFKRHFINIAGFCFDAEVIYDVTHNKPHFMGVSVYMLSLARTLFKFKSRYLTVTSPDFSYDGETFLMVAAIGKYNGGGMLQAPESLPDDGKFDVVVIPNIPKTKVMANVKNIFEGTHIQKIPEISTYRTNKLTIESKYQIRGEVEGELLPVGKYEIEMLPNALNVLTALK